MNKLSVTAILLLSLLSACLPGRNTPISQANPISPINPPSYELVAGQTAIETFNPPGAGATVSMTIATQVQNPNDFGIRLQKVNYEIFLANQRVAKQSIELDKFVLANAQTPLKFPITLSLNRKLELMVAVAQAFTGKPLPFRIQGETVFTSQSYQFTSRFGTLVQGETLARETLKTPELRLEDSASTVFLVEDAPVIKAVIMARNPGDVGYFLYGKDVTVAINGEQLALQDISPLPIAAGQDSRFELLFYPNLSQLSENARVALSAALEGTTASLEVTGQLLIDVLGVDTFVVPDGWQITGFVYR